MQGGKKKSVCTYKSRTTGLLTHRDLLEMGEVRWRCTQTAAVKDLRSLVGAVLGQQTLAF